MNEKFMKIQKNEEFYRASTFVFTISAWFQSVTEKNNNGDDKTAYCSELLSVKH